MKFGVMARGSQKIYILLTTDCPGGGRLVAESTLKDGTRIPVLTLVKDVVRGEHVLVLPLLHADQKLKVSVFDAEGDVVEEGVKDIGHLSSAFRGKYNTFRKVAGVGEIRNFDRASRPDCSVILQRTVCGIGLENQGEEIVTATLLTPCKESSLQDVPVSISAFDRNGNAIDLGKLTVLGDRVEYPVERSPHMRRVIDFSFRKPRDMDWLFLYAQYEDDALPPALMGFEGEQLERARLKSESDYVDTGQGPNYEAWFYLTQATPQAELEAQRTVRFEIEPYYSVIVPLFKTPLEFFDAMARSVLDQTYSKLELVLVNASPDDEALNQAVEEYARQDSRVKVVTLDENRGIALNTNEGIRVAGGDFLCFFDHDDVIEPDLLFEYTKAINEYPETDLLYCDEDKLRDGHYVDAFLKPDFSWELLVSNNYICHLLAVRKSIVDEVELSDDDVSGAQDWDMTMKVAEKARNVHHVPKVLYHWRIHSGSVASGSGAKPYTHYAGERAVQDHFDRIGLPVRIHDGLEDNWHHVEYLIPDPQPLVSIIIPNKDSVKMLGRLLDSIFSKLTYDNYEIVIVENNSTDDETFAFYKKLESEHQNLRVVFYADTFNFAAVCNFGAENAKGDYFLFLNNDMEVITPNLIELLLGPLQRDEVAAVGAQLLFPDDTIQHAGVTVCENGPAHLYGRVPSDVYGYFGILAKKRDVLAVTGACLMVSLADFKSIGGFDEEYVVEYNDVDFCLRLREKGRSVVIEPEAKLYHYESVSRGHLNDSHEKRMRHSRELARFMDRWAAYFAEGDPTYSRNVAGDSTTYELNWSLRK